MAAKTQKSGSVPIEVRYLKVRDPKTKKWTKMVCKESKDSLDYGFLWMRSKFRKFFERWKPTGRTFKCEIFKKRKRKITPLTPANAKKLVGYLKNVRTILNRSGLERLRIFGRPEHKFDNRGRLEIRIPLLIAPGTSIEGKMQIKEKMERLIYHTKLYSWLERTMIRLGIKHGRLQVFNTPFEPGKPNYHIYIRIIP